MTLLSDGSFSFMRGFGGRWRHLHALNASAVGIGAKVANAQSVGLAPMTS